jgi:hypothetical protein
LQDLIRHTSINSSINCILVSLKRDKFLLQNNIYKKELKELLQNNIYKKELKELLQNNIYKKELKEQIIPQIKI